MAISKIGSKALVDCSVATADLEDGSVSNAKLANSSITVNGTSVSLGASASLKDISWQSVVTADGSTATSAVAGNGYFIDTTSATHTLTLPSSPSIGDKIAIKDYAGTFATNNLTIGRNGNNIQGVANDSQISTNKASLILVYSDATKGWLYTVESNVADLQVVQYVTATGGTITTTGDFKIHTFTGDGCFVVSCGGNPVGSDKVDYLVVAGGGGGGGCGGAGAGAGGYRESHCTAVSGCYTASPLATPTSLTVTATTYPVTVGGGGTGGGPVGTNGSDSIFSTITSAGGGGGGNAFKNVSSTGGSGGGGAGIFCGGGAPLRCGVAGNTPPVSPPQGNPGGDSAGAPVRPQRLGGGGGAGAAGGNAPPGGGGAGGTGVGTGINPSPCVGTPGPSGPLRYFGGGGGGGNWAPCTQGGPFEPNRGSPGPGGTGGGGSGGRGGTDPSGNGTDAAVSAGPTTANTGGGGGGGGRPFAAGGQPGSSGGKGIVIIRYKFQN